MCRAFWCLICAFLFLNNAVHSENTGHVTARYLKRDCQNGIFFANFIMEKSRYLNVSSIGATAVKRAGECGEFCVQTPSCFSFNLASSPDVGGKLRCELLPTDKFNSSDKLQISEHLNHYSIKTVCDTKPCRNGGRCVAKYEEDDFSCSCVPGYEGRYCETDIEECSSNPCQNGGVCVDQVNGYVCSCAAGFTGGRCQNRVLSGQWTEYTPYICGVSNRIEVGKKKTAEECKSLCGSNCIAVEWWETGNRYCFECKDTSQKRTYTFQDDGSYPPHLFIKT